MLINAIRFSDLPRFPENCDSTGWLVAVYSITSLAEPTFSYAAIVMRTTPPKKNWLLLV